MGLQKVHVSKRYNRARERRVRRTEQKFICRRRLKSNEINVSKNLRVESNDIRFANENALTSGKELNLVKKLPPVVSRMK